MSLSPFLILEDDMLVHVFTEKRKDFSLCINLVAPIVQVVECPGLAKLTLGTNSSSSSSSSQVLGPIVSIVALYKTYVHMCEGMLFVQVKNTIKTSCQD